jgi:uncharacterized BrkB/YihY/UPF0761 family membrane protein
MTSLTSSSHRFPLYGHIFYFLLFLFISWLIVLFEIKAEVVIDPMAYVQTKQSLKYSDDAV